MRPFTALAVSTLLVCFAGPALAADYHLVPGSFVPDRGPDGNSVFLDAADGLILVDTGRHPEHRDRLLAYAEQRARPIVAIVNTHWHYDHTTGNGEILAAFPDAEVIASKAIDGPLYEAFIGQSRRSTEEFVASGKASPAQMAEVRRALAVMDDPSALRSKNPVKGSGSRNIGGRVLDVHLEPYAVTEGDVWLVDPEAKLAIVGDLVVATVPFMDTACPDGWRAALGKVAAAKWDTLIPGHGEPMTRPQFEQWRGAFGALVDCGRSSRPMSECADGWVRDARPFVAGGDEARIREMVDYYVMTRLRSSPAEQQKYCRPLAASAAPERG
jgi:glyoxylase-like metal-dependent hydrolase (beta-lactamase superfamily II)